MRIIDLIRNISPFCIDIKNQRIFLEGLLFELDTSDSFDRSYNIMEYEDTIVRYRPKHNRYYSIGIGTRKLRGWITISSLQPRILLDIQEIINEDESYLILKYGKILLEEV